MIRGIQGQTAPQMRTGITENELKQKTQETCVEKILALLELDRLRLNEVFH
mgnify:CR=1 FL=1